MSEEAVKALVLKWLQSTGVQAADVLTVRGAGSDWEGSTDEGYHSAFRVSIEFVADGRQRPVWVDVEGQQMARLWEFVLGHAAATQDSGPAGSDTGVADSDRSDSSGTNLRPGGEPSPSRQGRAIV